jgi:hypothetical protein
MGVLSTVFGLVSVSMSGGAPKKTSIPPINASSGDEEKFIQYVYALNHDRDQAGGLFGLN